MNWEGVWFKLSVTLLFTSNQTPSKLTPKSSLQYNISRSFFLVLILWNLIKTPCSFLFTLYNVELLKMVIFYLLGEKQNFLEQQVNEENIVYKLFCSKICVRDESTLCQSKNKSKRRNLSFYFDDVTRKKRKQLRKERDKKNPKYYAGDYCNYY